jgi:acyl dehydratase
MEFEAKEIRIGYELTPIKRAITQEKMNAFSAFSEVNVEPSLRVSGAFHTDEEYAKSKGLPGTLAQSMHYYAFVSEMLTAFFGEGWVRGGKLAMTFLRMVLAGDTITCKAVITGVKEDDDGNRVSLDVSCENQRREKVAVGTASGLVKAG